MKGLVLASFAALAAIATVRTAGTWWAWVTGLLLVLSLGGLIWVEGRDRESELDRLDRERQEFDQAMRQVPRRAP